MKFTVKELLSAGSHKWKKEEVDDVTLKNLEDLCNKINALEYAPPMYATSCLRSLADQKRINPKAMGSAHLYGMAVDISDPDGALATWLQGALGGTLMIHNGLWAEHPDYTKGWVHLQTRRPKSGNRFFIP